MPDLGIMLGHCELCRQQIKLMLSNFGVFCGLPLFGQELGPYWAYLAPFWAMLGHCGLCRHHIGLMLSHFGVFCGLCWPLSGKSWDHILAMLGHFYFVVSVGPCWARVGTILGLSWAILGYVGTFLATLAPYSAYLEPCWAALEQGRPANMAGGQPAQQQPAQQGHPPGMAEQQGHTIGTSVGEQPVQQAGSNTGAGQPAQQHMPKNMGCPPGMSPQQQQPAPYSLLAGAETASGQQQQPPLGSSLPADSQTHGSTNSPTNMGGGVNTAMAKAGGNMHSQQMVPPRNLAGFPHTPSRPAPWHGESERAAWGAFTW